MVASGMFALALVTVSRIGVGATPQAAPAPQSVQSRKSEPPRATYVEMYDIRDLAFPASLRRIAPAWEPAVSDATGSDAIARFLQDHARHENAASDSVKSDFAAWKLTQTLIQCVLANAKGDSNASSDFHCEAKESGALIVKADRDQHKTIDALLKSVRRAADAIPIDVRELELDLSAQELLKKFATARGTDGSMPSVQVLNPSPDEVNELVAHAGTSILTVPSLLSPQLDTFEVGVSEEISYISSFELTAIEGIGTIADPIIKTVKRGTTVRGRCVAAVGLPGSDPPPFALRLEVEVAELKRPIEILKTDLGSIQLPEVKRATIASTLAGTTGRALLIGGVPKPSFDPAAAAKKLYLLVTVGTPQHEH